jgi:hypothetical protein
MWRATARAVANFVLAAAITAPLQQAAPPALGSDKMFISTTHRAWVRMDDGMFGMTWVGFAFDDAGKFLATQRVRVSVKTQQYPGWLHRAVQDGFI